MVVQKVSRHFEKNSRMGNSLPALKRGMPVTANDKLRSGQPLASSLLPSARARAKVRGGPDPMKAINFRAVCDCAHYEIQPAGRFDPARHLARHDWADG